MEKDIFDIIQEKDYHQLNNAEMAELADFCSSEEEFLQMKSVLVNVHAMKVANETAPKPQVKQKLDDLFVAQSYAQASPVAHKGFMAVLYPRDKRLFERPLLQIAAVIILMLGILPFLLKNELPVKEKLAKLEEKKETSKDLNKDDSNISESKTAKAPENQKSISLMDSENNFNRQDVADSISAALTTSAVSRNEFYATESGVSGSVKESEKITFAETVLEHPDGVFEGSTVDSRIFSKPLSDQPEVLDLLTASF